MKLLNTNDQNAKIVAFVKKQFSEALKQNIGELSDENIKVANELLKATIKEIIYQNDYINNLIATSQPLIYKTVSTDEYEKIITGKWSGYSMGCSVPTKCLICNSTCKEDCEQTE